MSLEAVALSQLQKEVVCLSQIVRTYLFQREQIGDTGEESLEELLYQYSEKVMAEIEQEKNQSSA